MSNLDYLRVLIVDDEAFMRNTIRAMLRVIGNFIVAEASDGDTALRLVSAAQPELVLCDINMKPTNGLQFVERVRNHPDPALRDVKVMMLTVHADERTIQTAVHLRIDGYLVKPVSPKLLARRLDIMFKDRVGLATASTA